MRKTKVRVIGDPDLVEAITEAITDSFECRDVRTFNTTPARYAKTPGVTTYLTVKGKKHEHNLRRVKPTVIMCPECGHVDAVYTPADHWTSDPRVIKEVLAKEGLL